MNGRLFKVMALAVITMLITSLGLFAPASATTPPDGCQPSLSSPVCPGWTRQTYSGTWPDFGTQTCTVDSKFDPSATGGLWFMPLGDCPPEAKMTASVNEMRAFGGNQNPVSAIPWPVFVACPANPTYGVSWGYAVYPNPYAVFPWYTRQVTVGACGGESTPAGAGPATPTGLTAATTLPKAQKFCAARGKVAKKLKGKALRLAKKLGKPVFKCVPPKRHKHKKRRPSITSRTMPMVRVYARLS